MTNNELKNKLEVMALASENSIKKYVATEALEYGENPEYFFNNILNYGCKTGMITGLIYYVDTHKFFDTHYDEIEELRTEYEQSTGCSVDIQDQDLKNTLAWFAFEQTAYNLALELKMDV